MGAQGLGVGPELTHVNFRARPAGLKSDARAKRRGAAGPAAALRTSPIALNGEETEMKRTSIPPTAAVVALLGVLAGIALAAQDRYSLQVPGGLAFSEFRGYEDWQTIAASHNGDKMAIILGNPAMIEAYKSGIPENGKPFPDGAKMAKIHWMGKKAEDQPGQPFVPGALHDTDFMVKDSKRFADSGGWGWAEFEYDAASDAFRPGNENDEPPQAHDAQCGFACHTIVAAKDYVFTAYPKR
jgi:hypothetical protein